MSSALIETININADDFTDNFLTCPTCMSPYDDSEHSPKLLSCSHTLCRSCLERIASTAAPNASPTVLNSISRSVAAADAAVAAINLNESGSRLSSSSLASSSTSAQSNLCIRCPICRESIPLPRNGIVSLPPSFIINQLIDLVKNQRSRDIIPRCVNHTNEELLFCETCDKSFCSLCESHFKIASNADHIIIPFSIAIKRMTEIFLFKSNQCINSFNLALANVQNEILNLNQTVECVAQAVEASFDELKQVIDKRKQDLLKQLTKIKQTKTNVLNDQIKLIINEKQKVELECKQYHQVNIESKQLGAQIQIINEKLDCLRHLCEPRENSFVNYEYKFNNCIQEAQNVLDNFGRFKISNTYPPLCTAKLLDSDNNQLQNNQSAGNLAVCIQIETVDYYGNKRTEGGDPVSIILTDPYSRQTNLKDIQDLENGIYRVKFTPNQIGKYRIDVNIFSRPINKMPVYLNILDYVDSMWTFGGGSAAIKSFTFSNKSNSDKDFNMPISVRCLNANIYVLDSGNNRIKVLNKQGQFISNIKHQGLEQFSSTGLSLYKQEENFNLLTLNWRLKVLSDFSLNRNCLILNSEIELDEPICLMETYHPEIYLVLDNKKKLHLCSRKGLILMQNLENKLKTQCNLKSISCFCGNLNEKKIFLADSCIYEVDLDWLCEFKLDDLIEKFALTRIDKQKGEICFRKFSQKSSSLTSLVSTSSSNSTVTTFTTNSANSVGKMSAAGSYTALWHDKTTDKLLAAKADKQKTVIEVYNSSTASFEYVLENSQNEKPLRRVTSICTTDDGKLVCCDLVQNFVRMFRFV